MFSPKFLLSFLVIAYVAFAPAMATSSSYAQLSSLINMKNGAPGKGTPLTFNSIDAMSPSGISFTKGTSTITIKTAGTYFVVASPQVGFLSTGPGCSSAKTFTADYWVVQNGAAVANTGVRLTAASTGTDVIVSQGIFIFKAGYKIQVFGSGTCSQSVAIGPAGEAFIPSIIFSMYMI